MLPWASRAVIVRLSASPALGVVVAAARTNSVAAPGLTVIARPEPLVIEPSVTVTEVEPALTKTMAPFLPEETVATPSLKLIAVAVAKLVAVP